MFVGTEHGVVEAVDAATGGLVWERRLGSVQTDCYDMPGDRFGVSGTPVLDLRRHLLYVVGSSRSGVAMHALDLASGREPARWPVPLSTDSRHMHVWGALTLFRGTVYAGFAGMCDLPPYYGKVVAVDTRSASISAVWYAVRERGFPVGGGGVWGYGGVAVGRSEGSVYAATGNALPPAPQGQPHGESVVRLTRRLVPVAANGPSPNGEDVDFGATPMLFRPRGCPAELVVANKGGALFLYDRDRITAGPLQRIQVAQNVPGGLGLMIGVAAYSPMTQMVYLSDPGPDRSPYRHGLVAFRVGGDCRLHPAWQQTVGLDGGTTVSSPAVAGGVVYYGDGSDGRVFAFDARTGRELWTSGRSIGGPVYAAPVVVNGLLLVTSWDDDDGVLWAFAR